MRHSIAALLAVLVVVGTLGAGTALGAVQETTANETAGNGTNASANTSVAPGEQLSGVVGVQEAEIAGEVDARSFGLAVARADSDEARAAIIAEKVNQTERELGNLSEQREQLREARNNGSISQSEYRVRITELAARTGNVERIANDTANASEGLPAALLESRGVNATAIQRLRADAANLSGGEVSEIARRIAGNNAPGLEAREDRGQGMDRRDGAANGTDRGEANRPDGNETSERRRGGRDGQSGDSTATDGESQQDTTTADGAETTDDSSTDSTDETDGSGSSAGGAGSGGSRGGR